ncbi:MAG: NADH-quinone oxidoreductase subunit NuoK [Thermofilum sp.]
MMAEIYFLTSALLAAVGAYGALVSRSAIKALISLEILFNGVVLGALALTSSSASLGGFILVVFSVVLGSVEVGVLVSILVLLYRRFRSVDVYQVPGLEVVE